MKRSPLVVENEDGEEVAIPSRFEVCPGCEGKGTQDHPAFRNGITAEEWNSPDWDDESREDYLNGRYDVSCTQCSGQRVVAVPDEDRMTPALRALWKRHETAREELRRDERSERFLCGDWA